MIQDGLSLNGTSLYKLRHTKSEYDVRVILNLENWSRFTLLDANTDVHCGALEKQFPPTNVYPGYRFEREKGGA